MVDGIRGLMRPFITVALVGTLIYLVIMGVVDAKEIVTPTAMIISFWFGERSALKKPEQ